MFLRFYGSLRSATKIGSANRKFASCHICGQSANLTHLWYMSISLPICDLQNLFLKRPPLKIQRVVHFLHHNFSEFSDQNARGLYKFSRSNLSSRCTCILSIRILDLVKNLAVCDYGHWSQACPSPQQK
jgi:hypothetical protein